MRRLNTISWCFLAFAMLAGERLQADVVRLTAGGEIRGSLLEQESDDEVVTIRTLGGLKVSTASADVEFVKRRPLPVETYLSRSRQIPDTVAAHWELAEWCRTNRLEDQRREQLEMILDLDTDHEDARRTLGYVNHLGRWMTRDDMMTQRGYIKRQGRWVTRQEFELLEKNAEERDAELAWYPKVRLWLNWATSDNAPRAADGIEKLKDIRDGDAVAALTNSMARHESLVVRSLYVQILHGIGGLKPVKPLTDLALLDDRQEIRRAALEALTIGQLGHAFPYFIQGLKHENNAVVCRAAEALGRMGDARAVPDLIHALVTSHRTKVEVPVMPNVTIGVVSGGMDPRVFSGTMPPDIEIMARTGQLPYGVRIHGNPLIPQATRTITVRSEVKNAPVLAALEQLTGQNFGYNERDWRVWWALQKT